MIEACSFVNLHRNAPVAVTGSIADRHKSNSLSSDSGKAATIGIWRLANAEDDGL